MAATAYYPYTPDAPLAIIGVVAYTTLAAQAMGCGARYISSWNIYEKLPWAAQKLLLLWGPALIMFTVSLTSTEFAKTYKANSFISPLVARPLFFALNTILFFLLTLAVFMDIVTAESEVHAGHRLLKAVFIVRLVFWTLILLNNAESPNHCPRVSRDNVYAAPKSYDSYLVLQNFYIIAFAQDIMQLVRLCSRADGIINTTEWPLYAFDIYLLTRPILEGGLWYWPGESKKAVDTQDVQYQYRGNAEEGSSLCRIKVR